MRAELDKEPEDPIADAGQLALFEDDQSWRAHWHAMPEFIQEDLLPKFQVIVNFESELDVAAFAALVQQPVTTMTRSIWYPAAEVAQNADKRYAFDSYTYNSDE